MKQKIEKNFFIFKIIVLELGAPNSHNFEEDTCHQKSMC